MKYFMSGAVRTAAICVCVALFSPPAAGQTRQDGPWWPHPIWGPDDQAGASNWNTPEKILQAISLVKAAKVYELGHLYERDMPTLGQRSFTLHIVDYAQTFGPDSLVYNDEYLCAEVGQMGTQFDGPGHVGKRLTTADGQEVDVYYNGVTAEEMKTPYGLTRLGVENVKPYITRGILIDVAGYKGVEMLRENLEVTLADLRGALKKQGMSEDDILPGDVLLFNYGWWRVWKEPGRIVGAYTTWPGIGEEAARWIVDRKVSMVGSDLSVDRFPLFVVHRDLTLKHGIFNLEFMNLETLVADQVYVFMFVFTPLRIRGATGSPGRPLAIR